MQKLYDILSRALCPVGTVVAYAGSTAPAGWLLCNGGTFSSTTYPKLYQVLGSTTLPDLRGKFVLGTSSSHALKSTGGAESVTSGGSSAANTGSHTLTLTELPNQIWHCYGQRSGDDIRSAFNPGSNYGINTKSSAGGGGHSHTMAHTHSVSTMSPYYTLTYIIRAGGGGVLNALKSTVERRW